MACKDFTSIPHTNANEIQENVTTHNILVVIIISHYLQTYARSCGAEFEEGKVQVETVVNPKFHRTFSMLVLHLIQCPDLTFEELNNLISCGKYQLPAVFIRTFHREVYRMVNSNLDAVMDVFKNLDVHVLDSGLPKVHQCKVINSGSPIGIFLRRVMVYFDKMLFLQTAAVMNELKNHCSPILNDLPDFKKVRLALSQKEVEQKQEWKDLKNLIISIGTTDLQKRSKHSNSKYTKVGSWSPRQVELFIAQQIKLLKINESVALDPASLQQKLKDILQANPDHFDAHYLSYLNCLRVKEYCGALCSVQHYFNRQTSRVTNLDEKSRGYRYTSLNMALLNASFNHNEEALHYLKESIAVAHQVNDHICLQHALMWMYTLSKGDKLTMLKCSVTRSKDLELHQITSFSLQSMAQYLVENAENPSIVFKVLKKSEIYNYFNGLTDLRMTNNVQKAAIWNTYGYQRLATVFSLLVLEHDQSNNDVYNVESKCIAMCNIINDLIARGDYYLAPLLINEVSQLFPYEHSNLWIMAEQYLYFKMSLNKQEWPEAELAAKQMASINITESKLRLGELFLKKEDFVSATNSVKHLIENNNTNTILTKLRAYLIIAKANESAALTILMDAKLISIEYHLTYMTAIINIEIAIILMKHEFPHKALRLLKETKQQIYSGINVYDKAYIKLQIIKAKMMVNIMEDYEHSPEFLNKVYTKLGKVAEGFHRSEAITELKETIYLQALVADDLDMRQNRNKHAMEFRHLEEFHVATVMNYSF
ncbi:anaphase-promoting complex subunit 5 [Daktulosphaira vitifoliae]|uniref:anaphase-promoting complex subunit 5 n=1 Tax=Daktulosphaira vitifoliae TaxID=58002 RepID=UPI0021AACB46|nr:anaphase-promoting complex subunit 5 [Daktulosphaira vitifoliae]